MTIRLYYNTSGPLPWSVDEGTQDTERNVKEVLVIGVNGCTRESVGCASATAPTAWLEFTRATLEVLDGTAVIKLAAVVYKPTKQGS